MKIKSITLRAGESFDTLLLLDVDGNEVELHYFIDPDDLLPLYRAAADEESVRLVPVG